MPGYVDVFDTGVVQPSDVSYRAVALTADVTLVWPSLSETQTDVAARIMDVTPSAAGFELTMPDARQVSVGQDVLFFNPSGDSFDVLANDGSALTSVAPGVAKYIYLTDNSTQGGSWNVVTYGTGTSSPDASVLAGAGLVAIGPTLNQSSPIIESIGSYVFTDSDRADAIVFTGGSVMADLPLTTTVGSNWFVMIKNSGSGTVQVNPSGLEIIDEIDGGAALLLNPDESAFFLSNGAGAWYTIGRGRQTLFAFSMLVKNVAGNLDVTLNSTEAANKIIQFVGALTGNINVIVPNVVSIYWIFNNTSGAFSLTVKTAAGTGIPVSQGLRAMLLCDATNVVDADDNPTTSGLFADGNVGSPSISFSADTNTGFYRPAADTIGAAAGGVDSFRFLTQLGAVNYLTSIPGLTGFGAVLTPAGVDPNIDLYLSGKGSGGVNVLDSFLLSGNLTPATVAVQQDDYNPAGLADASVLRLEATVANVDFTGLAGGADGRMLVVENVGAANSITLKNNDGASLAANRFLLSGDITIGPNESTTLVYDPVVSQWRATGTSIPAAVLELYAENPAAAVTPLAGGTNSVVIGSSATSDATAARAMVMGDSADATAGATDSVVLGTGSQGSAADTVAIGNVAQASATGAIAIGAGNFAANTNVVVVGFGATAFGASAVSIGAGTSASGGAGTSLGSGSNAASAASIAIGGGAATDSNAISIGTSSIALAADAIALGEGALAQATQAIAIGSDANVNLLAVGAIAIGDNASVTAAGTSAVALGASAVASAVDTIAIGRETTATVVGAIAVGLSADATGNSSIAIGSGALGFDIASIGIGANASAFGSRSIAIGSGPSAPNTEAIAIGETAAANNNQDIAIGSDAQSNGGGSIAIGDNALVDTSSTDSIAIGHGASVSGGVGIIEVVAIGRNAAATGNGATAIGRFTTALAGSTVAVGDNADATATSAVAIGFAALGSGVDSLAVGESTTASGVGAIAIGSDAQATANSNIAIGDGANAATGTTSIAIGFGASATGGNNVVLGASASSTGSGGVAIGLSVTAGTDGVSIGDASDAVSNAVAVGFNAQASAADTIAVGENSAASGAQSVAIGSDAAASTTGSVAIGDGAIASTGIRAIAIGPAATASQATTIAIGFSALANIDLAIAIGQAAQATGTDAIALGASVIASGTDSVAIGFGANATGTNSVALGQGVVNTVLNTVEIGNSNTNKFNYSATGKLALAGTGAMFHLPNYTVATLPTAANLGGFIYVTDESGGAVPAFSDGANWRRVTDRAIVS